MKHFSEEELIAYQLHETQTRRCHLQASRELPSRVPISRSRLLRRCAYFPLIRFRSLIWNNNWQRLRGNLSVLTSDRPGRSYRLWHRWAWPAVGFTVAALVLFAVFGMHIHHTGEAKHNHAVNGHGPLTTEPTDPAIANHLDAAERLLTEVNNSSGPLDNTTREQAHRLLLQNAVYVRNARDSGDVAEAAVLENFGRVLTTLDNEPPTTHSTWRVRLEMNTSGLLLDIRILRQNDDHSQGAAQ